MADEELAVRVGDGDDMAFTALYERYRGPLYRYCYSILGEAEDARDAVQTAMLKVLSDNLVQVFCPERPGARRRSPGELDCGR